MGGDKGLPIMFICMFKHILSGCHDQDVDDQGRGLQEAPHGQAGGRELQRALRPAG